MKHKQMFKVIESDNCFLYSDNVHGVSLFMVQYYMHVSASLLAKQSMTVTSTSLIATLPSKTDSSPIVANVG